MTDPARLGRLRTRWAAIGAAVAVTLGAGGLGIARAASSTPAALVTIDPVRVLDTRIPVGLSGPLTAGESRRLDVTGAIQIALGDTQTATDAPVPDGASGIVANVTVVSPTSAGWVAVRPGDATGVPSTSSLNVTSAGTVVPNAVTVGIPTSGPLAGTIDLYFHGGPGATTDLLVDVVGYYLPGTGGGTQGPPGPAGPQGDQGPPGAAGDDLFESTVIVSGAHSATENGLRLSSAILNTHGSAQNPVTILLEPGVYQLGAGGVELDDHVSLVGSGRGVTTVIIDDLTGVEIAAGTMVADMTIQNLRDNPTTASKVITLTEADGAVLRDLELISEFDSGIQVGSSADVLIDGVDVDAGDVGVLVVGNTPPSIVTVLGSTISSERGAIWGLHQGNLVTVRDSSLTSERDTINAYQGGRVVIEHSTIVATTGAWARVNTAINTETVYEVAHTQIETQQPFASAGLLTAPVCLAVTTSDGSADKCP